jgi:hypothetical protein
MSGDALGSWNDGAAKRAILDFVARVTHQGTADYVPPGERFAVFDNDGTLWCEKPLPVQGDFIFRRLAEMAEQDPSLKTRQPWKGAAEKDYQWIGDVLAKHYRGDDRDLKVLAAGVLRAYGDAGPSSAARRSSSTTRTGKLTSSSTSTFTVTTRRSDRSPSWPASGRPRRRRYSRKRRPER